jgi:DNA-binding response OmpR family regulator
VTAAWRLLIARTPLHKELMTKPLNVLLVEDHDPLRQILSELLAERGFRIFSTERGDQALNMAREVQPDLGLLDMHLPGTTGLEVLLTIRREIGPMPAIMMSGAATKSEKEAARLAGVFEFLHKPIGFDHLNHTLDQLLHTHFDYPLGQPPAPNA